MKKIILTLVTMMGILQVAAQSKRVVSISAEERGEQAYFVNFNYDENNQLSEVDFQSAEGSNQNCVMKFTYEENKVTGDVVELPKYYDVYGYSLDIEQGKATKDEVLVDRSAPHTYVVEYGSDNRIMRVEHIANSRNSYTATFQWEDGNVKTYERQGSDYYDYHEFEYSDIDTPQSSPFFLEILVGQFPDYSICLPQYYTPQYFGTRPRQLVSQITMTESEDGRSPHTYIYNINYEFNSDGDITELSVTRQGSNDEYRHYYLSYEMFNATLVSPIDRSSANVSEYFNMNGMRLSKPGKGLTIVRDNNIVRKIIK